ncbi:MAG: hypothetical protein KAH24_06000 [Holophagae bacterium]|nr:hypothetical protein [Holophagae bacterium]
MALTIFFLFFSRGYRRPFFPYLYAGFLALLLGSVFTVTEGFIFPVFFNLVEHVCYAAGGIFFLIGCLKMAGNRGKNYG